MATELLMPDVDFGNDPLPDLYDRLAELRTHGTVVPVKQWGKPSWLVLGYEEIVQTYQDQANFSPREFTIRYSEPSMGPTIQGMEGDEHRKHRGVVAPYFLPAKVRAFSDKHMEPIIHELLDRIEDQDEVEFVEAFARTLPFTIITRILGIPVTDEKTFMHWAVKMIDFPWDPEGAVKAKAGFDSYVGKVVAERRAKPQDDLISIMTSAEVDGQTLDDEHVMAFCRMLFPAGSDTTYKAAGSLFATVLSAPEWRAMARESDAARSALVNEIFRWQPAVAMQPRMAGGDAEVGGVQIRKGDMMLLALGHANRDPKRFPDPDRFDPSRSNHDMVTFGHGVRFCVGRHLARAELEAALKLVFERFPDMELSPGRPIEYAGPLVRGIKELWVRPHGLA